MTRPPPVFFFEFKTPPYRMSSSEEEEVQEAVNQIGPTLLKATVRQVQRELAIVVAKVNFNSVVGNQGRN